MDVEDLHLCDNPADIGDEGEEKSNPVSCGLKTSEVNAMSTESVLAINHCQRPILEGTNIDVKEVGIVLEHSSDFANVDTAESGNLDECFLQEKTDVEVTAGDFPSLGPKCREPPEDAAGMNTTELLLDDGSWEHITNWTDNSTEQDTGSSTTGDFSDSSTLSAASLNSGDANSSQSDFWIMERQLMEPELRTDEINLVSCDSLSPGMEYLKTLDLGTPDVSMVPMESLHLSLVSNNNLLLGVTGTGTSSLCSQATAMTGGDWHMGSEPVKCLQLGAVTVASLTLGTVGISVIPMVSAGTIDINPFTETIEMVPMESLDWETVSTDSDNHSITYAGHVNVDSITPEGVRERWHPLEDRLCALGEALTALDKKIEGFCPRLREAETLLGDMECSLTQHAVHISDIMEENAALAQRILQLEKRMREDA